MKVRKILTSAAVLAAVGIAGPAFADTSYPAGGVWDHGVGGGRVWSDYYHADRCHGSSVDGAWYDEDYASAGNWSRASANDTWLADEAYYKFC